MSVSDRVILLLSAKKRIKTTIHIHQQILGSLKSYSTFHSLDELNYLLNLSQNMSLSHRAPLGWQVGMPLIRSHLPAPQLEEMRMGAVGLLAASSNNVK
eukprot:gene14945-20104_t